MSSIDWNEEAASWGPLESNELWRAFADSLNGSLIRRWVEGGEPKRILKTDLFDEAVGTGLQPELAPFSSSITGIDVARRIAEKARGRYPSLLALVADVRRLPFREETFDLVVSNSTLDHFPTLEELRVALHEVRRVLRAGGQLILTLDNPDNPLIALRNRLRPSFLRRSGLVPYYVGATSGRRTLPGLLEDAGFVIREMGAVLHAPRVLAIPLARIVQNRASPATGRRFLRLLGAFERLGALPIRFLSGHYVAVSAIRS